MANMRKFHDFRDIGHLCAHYERSVPAGHYSNEGIDQTRLHEDNINYAPPDRGKQMDYIAVKIKEIMGDRTLRKDAVKMCCWIVDAPATLPKEKRDVFFKAAYDFLVDRYGKKSGMGEDVVISCYRHKSETTEHIHFAFLPVVERNGEKSFCAKEAVGRDDLKTFHGALSEWMEQRGICKRSDILNGKTIRDASGRALSVQELKKLDRKRDREKAGRFSGSIENRERTHERGRWS